MHIICGAPLQSTDVLLINTQKGYRRRDYIDGPMACPCETDGSHGQAKSASVPNWFEALLPCLRNYCEFCMMQRYIIMSSYTEEQDRYYIGHKSVYKSI